MIVFLKTTVQSVEYADMFFFKDKAMKCRLNVSISHKHTLNNLQKLRCGFGNDKYFCRTLPNVNADVQFTLNLVLHEARVLRCTAHYPVISLPCCCHNFTIYFFSSLCCLHWPFPVVTAFKTVYKQEHFLSLLLLNLSITVFQDFFSRP